MLANSGRNKLPQPGSGEEDELYQISLLNGLMLGDYDGTVTIGELLQKGDTGIGTFDRLDGEMIILEGVAYKAKADGTVEVQSDSATSPLAMVTFFHQDIPESNLAEIADMEQLEQVLDHLIAEKTGDFNRFYAAIISGDFDLVHVRAFAAQTKPYRPLAQLTSREHYYQKLAGTIVALRYPVYEEGVGVPGWHMHFLSADKSKGGHLFGLKLVRGSVSMDEIREFELVVPDTPEFGKLNLGADLHQETLKVEVKR